MNFFILSLVCPHFFSMECQNVITLTSRALLAQFISIRHEIERDLRIL